MTTVLDFGAVGDGQTDDTDAIQHAIDDGGGDILLPKGNYRITRSLKVDLGKIGRTSLSGSGGKAKLIMEGPGPAIHFLGNHTGSADPNSFMPGVWDDERCPMIDGLEIEGTHPEADGIRLEGTVQATLTRLLIRKVHTAVHVFKRNRNVLIDACHFYFNTGIGVHLDHVNLHQIIISSSHISYCRLGGIRVDGGEVRNFEITGNDIEYNNFRAHREKFPSDVEEPLPTGEIYIDIQDGSVREGTVASNTIQGTIVPGGSNIRLIGSERDEGKLGLWSITGNLIGNEEHNIHLTNGWGVVISGNNIYGASKRNVQIEGSRNVVMSGNMFGQMPDFNRTNLMNGIRIEESIDCTISGLQIQDPQTTENVTNIPVPESREALVELVKCDRVNLSGCQILDAIGTGLLLEDCRETLISQTQVIDQRSNSLMEKGIEFRGNLEHVMVSGCQIRRATGSPVTGLPHAGVTFSNNVTG